VEFEIGRKSFWKERNSRLWTFLCAHCKTQRRLPYRPQPGGIRHFFQVGLTAAVFTCITWKWFHWKGIVSFVPFWMIFEFFYRSRTRAALSCPHCGFDPVLFMVDAQRARHEIEAHWQRKLGETQGPPASEPAVPLQSGQF
jgi:hypothetical protein